MESTRASNDHNAAPRTGRILVVDDDADFADGMDLLLTPEGHEVLLAHSAEDANEKAGSFQPDIALIDIRLTGTSGVNLIATLRKQQPDIICIMMTAYASTDTAIAAMREGAYAYLVKPFGREELLLTIERSFERLDLQKGKAKLDAELRSRNEDLAKSEYRYRSLVESCPICIKELDLAGTLLDMNAAGLAMLGLEDVSEIQGTNYFVLIDTEFRRSARKLFEQACTGETTSFEWSGVFDSIPRFLGTSFTPLPGPDGSTQKIVAITQDITDQKAAEVRLREENLQLREEVRLAHSFDEIIGQNKLLKDVLSTVEKVAPTDVSVLILGETGTGKELIARAIHKLSSRRDKPMVSINCPALPENLIESELFGHEPGAFTGAQSQRKGRFELADGGTIFLDELGELPLLLQAKLLRVLQTGEFERLGGTKTLRSDVRLIAATNQNLKVAAAEGTFRSDLYYRVSSFPVRLPALRERRDDIPLLAEHFVLKHRGRLEKNVDAISSLMMDQLMAHSWPGNIRELESVIERALITSGNNTTLELDVPLKPGVGQPTPLFAAVAPDNADLSSVERSHIVRVLEETGWTISGKGGAASVLKLAPSTLRSKMKRLGIRRESA